MRMMLPEAIAAFDPALPLAVAYSGGADSTALLLACVRRWPGQVGAIHVHHGLQAAADAFQQHCQDFCALHAIPLDVRRVDARHAIGQSPEDAARTARYDALDQALRDGQAPLPYRSVALAQHADDQVETLLLALSRGAGVPGLAAMPARWERHGVQYHRPMLQVHGASVREWLRAQGVQPIEDPSNTNEAYTRNRIRARLLPALEAAFPSFRETFARSARHAAQAQRMLEELASIDLQACASPADAAGKLQLRALRSLSRERQANLLRHWLKTVHATVPSTAQLQELLSQLQACTTRGHHIRIRVAGGWAVREGDGLAWYNRGLGPTVAP